MILLSHVRGDGDVLQAWFEHYLKLGVTAFHLVVHGPRAENATLYRLVCTYPVFIRDEYEGEFLSEEKAKRLNRVLATMPSEWMFTADSDEFVELPYRTTARTIQLLERVGATALYAPFVHRLAEDGSLDTPEVMADPFRALPLCSVGLYRAMGVQASGAKYPLFRKSASTRLEAGNHAPPNGAGTVLSGIQGATHHFKWRRAVLQRLANRANSTHTWRHESAGFLAYLAEQGGRLPSDDTFRYSRRELFRRGLLRRAGAVDYGRRALAHLSPILPGRIQRGVRRLGRLAVQRGLVRRIDG